MTARFTRGLGAAVVYVFTTQAAFADLTANDVWSDWKGYLTSTGYSVSGDEQSAGGALTVSDVAMSMEFPEDEGSIVFALDRLVFSENGDGTVSIKMPDSSPMTFNVTPKGEEPVSGVLTLTQSDMGITASGSPGDVTYKYAAARLALELTSLTVDGAPVPDSVVRAMAVAENLNSTSRMLTGDLRTYSAQTTADSLSYDIFFDDPDSEDMGKFKGVVRNVTADGTGSIPLEMDTSDLNASLQAGFAAQATLAYGDGNSTIEGTGDGESFGLASASKGGSLTFEMDASHMAYDVNQQQMSMTMTSAELPVPVEIAVEQSAFNLSMPIQKSDDEQDFAFGLNLTNFTMSDLLWSMFDPAAQLPRDPATVVLDTTGKGKLLLSFFDPKDAAILELGETPPGEISALTIKKLIVSLVGANLVGSGDFTFDNSDKTTMDGFPRPTGHIDLKLTGANALLDKLISMGFVAEQEAMGARMMMGLLAVPGEEPDSLSSKIEINDQGHILANGQRIQ